MAAAGTVKARSALSSAIHNIGHDRIRPRPCFSPSRTRSANNGHGGRSSCVWLRSIRDTRILRSDRARGAVRKAGGRRSRHPPSCWRDRRTTPEPVIGPRIARTRWAPIRPTKFCGEPMSLRLWLWIFVGNRTEERAIAGPATPDGSCDDEEVPVICPTRQGKNSD